MSFYGCSFIFDGVPSEEYGLRIYGFDNTAQGNGSVGTNIAILEDRTLRSSTPIHYGVSNNSPLSFDLVFGALEPLDRYDVAAIAGWLTGHAQYKPFTIVQPDMELFHFKVIVTSIEIVPWSGCPIAFKATIQCDCPFAYMSMDDWTASSTSSGFSAEFDNRSNVNTPYRPRVFEITYTAASLADGGLTIQNQEFANAMQFTGLSSFEGERKIVIDSATQVVVADGVDDIYSKFNFVFPCFARGKNVLTSNNKPLKLRIAREFQVNIGS
nr:phage tail domain-containing protein [uncultured Ruminococcus sp.]